MSNVFVLRISVLVFRKENNKLVYVGEDSRESKHISIGGAKYALRMYLNSIGVRSAVCNTANGIRICVSQTNSKVVVVAYSISRAVVNTKKVRKSRIRVDEIPISKGSTVTTTFKFDEATYKMLEDLCKKLDMNRSRVVRYAIEVLYKDAAYRDVGSVEKEFLTKIVSVRLYQDTIAMLSKMVRETDTNASRIVRTAIRHLYSKIASV